MEYSYLEEIDRTSPYHIQSGHTEKKRKTPYLEHIFGNDRSSRWQIFLKINVLKNFHNIHTKALVLETLLNRVDSKKRVSNIDVFL